MACVEMLNGRLRMRFAGSKLTPEKSQYITDGLFNSADRESNLINACKIREAFSVLFPKHDSTLESKLALEQSDFVDYILACSQ